MELDFKKKLIIFFLILLVIILFIISYTINDKSNNIKWPPYVANCPDYWLDLSSNGSMCYNKHSLGTCGVPTLSNDNTIDFTRSIYTSSQGDCNKKKWAETCGVSWDGITYGYGNNNPCSSN
jgi:hypothetical protein